MTIEQFKADLTKHLPDSIYIQDVGLRDGLVIGSLIYKGEVKSFVFKEPASLDGVDVLVAQSIRGQLQ